MFREIWLLLVVADILVSAYLVLRFQVLKHKSKTTVRLLRMYHGIGIFSSAFLIVVYGRQAIHLPAWVWAAGLAVAAILRTYGLWQFALHMAGDIDRPKKP